MSSWVTSSDGNMNMHLRKRITFTKEKKIVVCLKWKHELWVREGWIFAIFSDSADVGFETLAESKKLPLNSVLGFDLHATAWVHDMAPSSYRVLPETANSLTVQLRYHYHFEDHLEDVVEGSDLQDRVGLLSCSWWCTLWLVLEFSSHLKLSHITCPQGQIHSVQIRQN